MIILTPNIRGMLVLFLSVCADVAEPLTGIKTETESMSVWRFRGSWFGL